MNIKRWIKQKSFLLDGYKLVTCRNCLTIIGETHLGEKNSRTVVCKNCGNKQIIAPPRIQEMNGRKVAFWCEPSDSCFTTLGE